MRILFVTPYYPPQSYGGIESHVATLAGATARTGKAVVLGPGPHEGIARKVSGEGVVEYRTIRLEPYSPYEWSPDDYGALFRRVIEREQPTHVLAHNLHLWIQPEIVAALHRASSDRGIPVILRNHNFCARSEAKVLLSSPWTGVCAVSSALAEQTAEIGVPPGRIEVVPAPVATHRFRPEPHERLRRRLDISRDAPILLHASRIVGGPDPLTIKGLTELLCVLQDVQGAHLVIAAARPGPALAEDFRENRTKLRRLAEAGEIGHRVHVISAPAEEMPNIYNGCDVFVMLSRLETFGRAYAEASSCGLPAVGTDTGGIPEVVLDGESGFTVRTRGEAVEALERLIADRTLRERLGRAGRRHVEENFSIGAVAPALGRVLHRFGR